MSKEENKKKSTLTLDGDLSINKVIDANKPKSDGIVVERIGKKKAQAPKTKSLEDKDVLTVLEKERRKRALESSKEQNDEDNSKVSITTPQVASSYDSEDTDSQSDAKKNKKYLPKDKKRDAFDNEDDDFSDKKASKTKRKFDYEEKSDLEIFNVEDMDDEEDNDSTPDVEIEYVNPVFQDKATPKSLKEDFQIFTFPKHAKRTGKKYKIAKNKVLKEVKIYEGILIKDLAQKIAEKSKTLLKKLTELGIDATESSPIDIETAQILVEDLGHSVIIENQDDIENQILIDKMRDNNPVPRAPIVTIMGHVDHGKTSLLDALRSTNIISKESGGITQHIGAYQYQSKTGKTITFLDTPGHEAFSSIRSRGSKITDIVVLVVAADDSIKEQTVEAINHAKFANVPIIIAINKIDKPEANSQKIKTDLMQHEIFTEDMGGETLSVEISALKKINLDKLIDAILLQTELMDLKIGNKGKAIGVILESKLEKGKGSTATVIVQKGTLNKGDIFISGTTYGRVRTMNDENNKPLKVLSVSEPAEVCGFNDMPLAGDDFIVVNNEQIAKEVIEHRKQKLNKIANQKVDKKLAIEDLLATVQEKNELTLIIKADTFGSMEAINSSINKIEHKDIDIKIIHSGVGAINSSDIAMASVAKAFIFGFNVRANSQARSESEKANIELIYHSIIYNLIDNIKELASGLLPPELQEVIIGYAEVRETFNVSSFGTIAGCYVTEGIIKADSKVRLLRDNVVIYEGSLNQLKRFKDKVKEVSAGYECGISFNKYNDIKVGDFIESVEVKEIAKTIE